MGHSSDHGLVQSLPFLSQGHSSSNARITVCTDIGANFEKCEARVDGDLHKLRPEMAEGCELWDL